MTEGEAHDVATASMEALKAGIRGDTDEATEMIVDLVKASTAEDLPQLIYSLSVAWCAAIEAAVPDCGCDEDDCGSTPWIVETEVDGTAAAADAYTLAGALLAAYLNGDREGAVTVFTQADPQVATAACMELYRIAVAVLTQGGGR